MKITFTELEPEEQELFEAEFWDQELAFVDCLDEVPADTAILSTFIASRIEESFLSKHPALRLIATRSTTLDHIARDSCNRRKIEVRWVRSYGDYVVPEHAFALILALARRLRQAMAIKGNRFSYHALRGTELRGKTLGILGMGHIGLNMVPMARGFGLDVIAHDIAPRSREASEKGFRYVELDEIWAQSDIISLHLPINARTFHILNKETLARCRRGVLIINTARGRLIATEALLEALVEGHVGGAGLDVVGEEGPLRQEASHIIGEQILARLHGEAGSELPTRCNEIHRLLLVNRLIALPNVVFTPHIAFNCTEAIARIHDATVRNIRGFLEENAVAPSSHAKAGQEDDRAESFGFLV